MSIKFNADEIFEIAEQVERNGAAFYRKAAGNFDDSAMKKKLLDLAVMEDAHEKRFTILREELVGQDAEAFVFDPDNQAALYLQAVAEGKIFDLDVEPAAFLSDDVSAEDVFLFAIGLEKDSVVFYNSMKAMVSDDLGKKHIDEIIIEEIGHVAYLRTLIDEL